MDTLVFDIETQNFFTDPGIGWDYFLALQIFPVGVYSYLYDKYEVFDEREISKLVELFDGAGRLVGFSMNRYDIPVLDFHFRRMDVPTPNIWEKERIDLLEEIEIALGQRISLSKLAEVNLGVKKELHGSEAIKLYGDGKIDELKKYCLNDVKLTKELYDLYRKKGELIVPDKKTGENVVVQFKKEAAALF